MGSSLKYEFELFGSSFNSSSFLKLPIFPSQSIFVELSSWKHWNGTDGKMVKVSQSLLLSGMWKSILMTLLFPYLDQKLNLGQADLMAKIQINYFKRILLHLTSLGMLVVGFFHFWKFRVICLFFFTLREQENIFLFNSRLGQQF